MLRTLVCVWAVGCAGSKNSEDSGLPPEPDPYEPTWAGMQRLFDDHCNDCHPAQNGIDLLDAGSRTTTPIPGYLPWITPGEPDQSWMWLVVSNQAGISSMPPGTPLPLETVDPMREWIENGALFE